MCEVLLEVLSIGTVELLLALSDCTFTIVLLGYVLVLVQKLFIDLIKPIIIVIIVFLGLRRICAS